MDESELPPIEAVRATPSHFELFVFFIGFALVTSLWSSIGVEIMQRWAPKGIGLFGSAVIAVLATLLFTWTLSRAGLSILSFGG